MDTLERGKMSVRQTRGRFRDNEDSDRERMTDKSPQRERTREVHIVKSTQKPNNRPFVKGIINGVCVSFMLDTGPR